ncbi:MAG: hypothetical protein H6838_04755 [Planctomycetes bacterium]|nr:hypothetical protein [Planctomycetota bacterium]
MMTVLHRVAAALLPASAILMAQTPTVTATVTQPLTVSSSYPSAQQSVPAGPLPAAGVNLAVISLGSPQLPSLASATLDAMPTASGFRLRAGGSAGSSMAFTVAGEIVLDLTLPSPAPVLVRLTGTAQWGGTGVDILVDLDNDQTVEAFLSPTSLGLTTFDIELGLNVGPTGRSIRLVTSGSGAGFWANVSGSTDLLLSFVVGAAPLSAYGPGCFELGWSRDAVGTATLQCPAPAGSLAAFAFGFTPRQIALPIAPGCFQLLDPLAAVLVLPSNGIATFTQPALALPPGLDVRFQAAVFDAGGGLQTSNGLLMTGPM